MLWVGCPCRGLLFRVRSDPCQSRYTSGSRSPSASSSSVKPMVLSHPLSLLFVVANSRQENYSFSRLGQAGFEPAFPIHRVVTIGYCPHLHLHYTIVFEVCQEGFKLLSTSRRFGVIRGALLVLFGSPLDNYYYSRFFKKVNTFFKSYFFNNARAVRLD